MIRKEEIENKIREHKEFTKKVAWKWGLSFFAMPVNLWPYKFTLLFVMIAAVGLSFWLSLFNTLISWGREKIIALSVWIGIFAIILAVWMRIDSFLKDKYR